MKRKYNICAVCAFTAALLCGGCARQRIQTPPVENQQSQTQERQQAQAAQNQPEQAQTVTETPTEQNQAAPDTPDAQTPEDNSIAYGNQSDSQYSHDYDNDYSRDYNHNYSHDSYHSDSQHHSTRQNGAVDGQTGNAAANAGAAADLITADTAKSNALAHAGLSSDQVTFVESKLGYEDGRQVYEVEFYTSDYREYDYEIDAYTGEVVSFDYDKENIITPYTPSGNDSAITEAKARELALAKVPGATASDIKEFKMDYDDGRTEYEGKIIYGGIEYEFEIDASTGAFLDWEAEPYGH